MDRRRFLLTSASTGALMPVLACGPTTPAPVGELGEFGNPFSAADPGPWADKVAVHQPVLYAGLVNDTEVRLWVEVGAEGPHEQVAEHYIDQIIIRDDFENDVAVSPKFPFNAQARLITTVTLEAPVSGLYVYENCNLHGWWRTFYGLDDAVLLEPAGDNRRPYTQGKPNVAGVANEHLPILGIRPDGQFSIEVGDRAAGALHPQAADHYIQQIQILDENDQVRGNFGLSPGGEPVVNFAPIGAQRLRILALCNQHQWWEAEYEVTPPV